MCNATIGKTHGGQYLIKRFLYLLIKHDFEQNVGPHFLNFGQPGHPFKFNCFHIHFGESIITRHENWSRSHLFFPKLKVLAGTKKSFVFSHFNSISTVVSFKQILSSQMGKFTIHLLGKFLHVNFIYPLRGDS